jgi:hypothetical protein
MDLDLIVIIALNRAIPEGAATIRLKAVEQELLAME